MPESLSSSKQSLQKSDVFGMKFIIAQIVAALSATILTINISAMTTTMTLVIADLKMDEYSNVTATNSTSANFKINIDQASFYATLQLVCHFIAGVAAGVIQDIFGRRSCMLLSIIPQIASWVVLFNSTNVYCLYLHALLCGISTSFSEQPVITYVGEISNVKLRGPLFSIGKMGYAFGALAIYSLAVPFHWKQIAYMAWLLPFLTFFYIFLLPESPIWLLSKGRVEECRRSMKWLNGWTTDEHIEQEFSDLQSYVIESNKFGTSTNEVQSKFTRKNWLQYINENYIKLFLQSEFIRPFKICMAIFLASYCLSLRPAKAYMVNVLQELGETDKKPRILAFSTVFQVFGSITLALTVRKFGKRPLILWTFTLCAFCLMLFGAYSYVHTKYNFDVKWILYVVFSINFYFAGYTLGGMPWFINAEIFPQKIRGVAGGIVATLAHLLVAILTETYLYIEKAITLTNVFFVYAAISFLCILYIYKCLPETENKTLQEIEEFFKSKNSKRKRQDSSIN